MARREARALQCAARMRNHCPLALALVLAVSMLAACATATRPEPDAAPPPTLHAQLTEPVHLAIDPLTSTGDVTAAEHQGSDWLPSRVPLTIETGAFELASVGDDLVIHSFEVDLAPIALPMLPGTAQLTDIAVRLPAPVTIGVTWQGSDDAVAIATLDLQLVWSFTANGGTLPLGTQALPAVPIALAMHGEHGSVTAEIGLDQPGQLWSWADLLALDDLALQLPAQTAPAVPQ
jgi:hypothetical protein